jgi:2,5-diketo-D-gluconate reductase B
MPTPTLPPVGLGTGGAEYLSGQRCTDVVSTALELGYRHVDTAVMYGNHEAVGRGIRTADVPREEVVLGTKVPHDELEHADVIDCLKTSRDELGVDRIDIAYVHFPGPAYDPEGTLAAFEELVADGTIAHLGVSNFSVEQLSEALEIAGESLLAVQAELHPLCRQPELVEFVQEHDVHLVGYAPLARGEVFQLDVLAEIADKHGVSPAQVSLAWMTRKPNVVAVAKSSRRDHLADNLRAPELSLDGDDVRRIESITRTERLIDPGRYEAE